MRASGCGQPQARPEKGSQPDRPVADCRDVAEGPQTRAQRRACAQPYEDGAAHGDKRAQRVLRANACVWGRAWVAQIPARRTTRAWLSVGLPCYHVAGAKQSRCTINEG